MTVTIIRRPLIAVLCTAALFASVLVATQSIDRHSAKAAESAPTSVDVAPDPVSARVDALASGHRVEDLSSRTETTQVFINPDGTATAEVAEAPVRVRSESGKDGWRPIDLSLQKLSDGSVRPTLTSSGLQLSGGAAADDAAPLVTLGAGESRSLSLGWPDDLPAPTLSGNTATYADVLPDVDLKVQATRSGYEQFFVVKSRPDADDTIDLTLPITTKGLKVSDSGNSDTDPQTITTTGGTAVGQISAATTWDSGTGENTTLPDNTTVSDSTIATVDGKPSLVIKPDNDFLQDPDTTYPVTIDPSVTISGTALADTYVRSLNPDSNYAGASQLAVGTTTSGTDAWRSFLSFQLGTSFNGAQITSATLGLWESLSWSCTATNFTTSATAGAQRTAAVMTWNNQPALDSSHVTTTSVAKGFSSSCAAGPVNVDVTPQMQVQATANSSRLTVALTASETSNTGWKQFDSAEGAHVPTLSVTYDQPPAVPAAPAVSSGATLGSTQYTTDLSPKFTSKSADPDGDSVHYATEVYSSSTVVNPSTLVTSCTTAAAPSGAGASCAGSTTLTDGTTYYVRSKAIDAGGLASAAWSSWLTFATAAATPAVPTVSCPAPYSDGSWGATAPGAVVTCTVSAVGSASGASAKKITVSVDGGTPKVVSVGSSGTTSTTVQVSQNIGIHRVEASTSSAAQLSSALKTYRFGYGSAPAVSSPARGTKTLGNVDVAAYSTSRGTSTTVTAKFQWRVSGVSGQTAGWNTISTTDVTPTSSTDMVSFKSSWDSTTATADTSVYPPVVLNPRQNTLFDLRVCFTYSVSGLVCPGSASITTILRVPSAFGDGFPTSAAGEGQVALWTGEFQESMTDVNVTTNIGSLSISRDHSTFANSTGAATGVFGPGWNASFDGSGTGNSALIVDDETAKDGSISFSDPSGAPLVYTTPTGIASIDPTGTYIPVDDATTQANEKVAITGSGTSARLTMTDFDGTVTTWQPATSTSVASWVPLSVVEAGSSDTTTFTTDSAGRVTKILAPIPVGVTCPTTGSLNPGCSSLRIAYASTTTATTGTPGDFAGQVQGIYFTNWNPDMSAMSEIQVAAYVYDTSGRIVTETNSLTSLTKTYQYATYNGFTELTQSTATGYAPYIYTYSTTGGNLKLASVSRGPAVSGGSNVVLSSYVYNAAPGSAGPTVTGTQVAKWGQTRVPTATFAVFSMDHPVTGTPTSTDWPFATLFFTDASGYTVNNATYGAGQWLLTYDNYDSDGNYVNSLSAADINTAIGDAAAGIAFDPNANSTITRYLAQVDSGTPGVPLVASNSVVEDTWSAPFASVLANGSTATVRTHTHYDYDQGAPNSNVSPTGGPYLLPTTTTTGVAGVADTTIDPTVTLPNDIETTSVVTDAYDPIDGSSITGATSGWTLGQPTVQTTVMPNTSDNVVKKARYDAEGNLVESRDPGSGGSDAGTHSIILYTAGTNSQDSNCGGQPQWAGLNCWSGVAAPPASGNDIPDSRISAYNRWLEPLSILQTSGGGSTAATRTTTITYYSDGRAKTAAVSTTGLSGSSGILKMSAKYDATTLAAAGTSFLNLDGSVNSTDQTAFDLWGRTTTYVNSLGNTTTTAYVASGTAGAGQVSTVANSTGTSTYAYDGTDANGATEHRGLATGLSITGVGNFAAAYDANEQLITQSAPAGIVQNFKYDSAGRLSSETYSGDVTTGGTTATGVWLAFGRDYNNSGQVAHDWSPAGSSTSPGGYTKGYLYDRSGRLVHVNDSSGSTANGTQICTQRAYQFDPRGNRTLLTSTTGADCAATGGINGTSAYDAFSRQLTGNNGVGAYVCDAFGRQTTIPAADAPGGANKSISIGYFDNDAVSSITQDATLTTFALDPTGRRLSSSTSVGGGAATVTTNHYGSSSDTPDWVSRVAGGVTTTSRYLNDLGHALGVSTITSGPTTTSSLQLSDPSGSFAASVTVPSAGHATALTGMSSQDEYGNQSGSSAQTGVVSYGWAGAAQREVSNAGLVLMGARVYNPSTGRFTSSDLIAGGNENAYNYPDDPINFTDYSGMVAWWQWAIIKVAATIVKAVLTAAICAAPAVGTALCVIAAVLVSALLGGATAALIAIMDHKSNSQVKIAAAKGMAIGAITGLLGRTLGKALAAKAKAFIVDKLIVWMVNFIIKRWG